jgi:glycine reductase
MAKEIERAGIPTALVTALVPVAQSLGVPRIIAAPAIIHPTGNPRLPLEDEQQFRLRLVELALQAVSTDVAEPRVFTLAPQETGDEKTGVMLGSRWLH